MPSRKLHALKNWFGEIDRPVNCIFGGVEKLGENMYSPILLASYSDGRRVFQFEKPVNLSGFSEDVYYFARVIKNPGKERKYIIYVSKPLRDILGKIQESTVFCITDGSGELDDCVFRDGGCVSIERSLSPEERELEGRRFKKAIGLKGN